jgi:opacity protein-like surface antigen
VQSGWIWSDIDTTYTAAGGVFGNSWGHDTQMVGGQIGLQHQFGLIVVGVEGDLVSAFRNHEAVEVCPNVAVDCHARFNDVVTLGGRLGYSMGKWLPFLSGGYANGSFDRKTVNRSTSAENDHDHSRHSGWYVGGGVDMALAHGWNIGLEYRHYDFDDSFHLAFNPAGAAVAGSHNVMDASSDSIALRVSWKLGRPDAVVPLK